MMATTRPRLMDPGVASVIFSPAPRNRTLSSVMVGTGLGETFAIEWIADQEPETVRYLIEKRLLGGAELRQLVSCLCQQYWACVAQAPVIVSNTTFRLPSETPARTFPFAGHFDILALPVVEGMDFDIDVE